MKTKIVVTLVLLVTIAGIYASLQYNKPHQNIESSDSHLTTTATALITDFENNMPTISKELLGNVLSISGRITAIEKSDQSTIVILDKGVKCELQKGIYSQLAVGQEINIKGIYSGFDELFNEITLARCVLIN